MNRDELIQQLADESAEVEKELAEFSKKIDKALADVEKIEEPKKRLEKLRDQAAQIRNSFAAKKAAMRERIKKSAPEVLRNAIKRLSNRRHEPHVERAIGKLHALAFVPGDLSDSVRKILLEIADAELALCETTTKE